MRGLGDSQHGPFDLRNYRAGDRTVHRPKRRGFAPISRHDRDRADTGMRRVCRHADTYDEAERHRSRPIRGVFQMVIVTKMKA